MTRHARNCTAGAVYTYSEKRKDTQQSGYGSQSARFGKDSLKEFDCCCLTLQPCRNPVITADGYLYDKEAILEYIIHQKREISRKLKEFEKQKTKFQKEASELKKLEQEAKMKVFVEKQSISVGQFLDNKSESKPAADAEASAASAEPTASTSGASASGSTGARQKDQHLPSFWIPSLTPQAKQTEVKKPIVKALGGDLVDSIYECTHLVTDQVRRTVKFLCGLARGLPIVDHMWLERCKAARTFIDAGPFVIQDKVNEKKFGFSLLQSINRASEANLLGGYKLHVSKSVRPDASQMKDIIKSAGGEYITAMPKKYADHTVIISCEVDKAACKSARDAGLPVVSAEFILTGILLQELNIDKHKLFAAEATSTGNTTKRPAADPKVNKSKKRRR